MTKVVRRGPVVVDTGVFAAELTRSGSDLAEPYRPLLEGRNVFISFVTEAEVRFGARRAGWGAARLRKLEQRLAAVEVVWPGPGLVEESSCALGVSVRATGSDKSPMRPTGGSLQRQSGSTCRW